MSLTSRSLSFGVATVSITLFSLPFSSFIIVLLFAAEIAASFLFLISFLFLSFLRFFFFAFFVRFFFARESYDEVEEEFPPIELESVDDEESELASRTCLRDFLFLDFKCFLSLDLACIFIAFFCFLFLFGEEEYDDGDEL